MCDSLPSNMPLITYVVLLQVFGDQFLIRLLCFPAHPPVLLGCSVSSVVLSIFGIGFRLLDTANLLNMPLHRRAVELPDLDSVGFSTGFSREGCEQVFLFLIQDLLDVLLGLILKILDSPIQEL